MPESPFQPEPGAADQQPPASGPPGQPQGQPGTPQGPMQPTGAFGPAGGPQGGFTAQVRAFAADTQQVIEIVIELQRHALDIRAAMPADKQQFVAQVMAALVQAQNALMQASTFMTMSTQPMQQAKESFEGRVASRLNEGDLIDARDRFLKRGAKPVALGSANRWVTADMMRRAEKMGQRCTKCLDVPGKDGLGRPCKGCAGTGFLTEARRPARDPEKAADRRFKRGLDAAIWRSTIKSWNVPTADAALRGKRAWDEPHQIVDPNLNPAPRCPTCTNGMVIGTSPPGTHSFKWWCRSCQKEVEPPERIGDVSGRKVTESTFVFGPTPRVSGKVDACPTCGTAGRVENGRVLGHSDQWKTCPASYKKVEDVINPPPRDFLSWYTSEKKPEKPSSMQYVGPIGKPGTYTAEGAGGEKITESKKKKWSACPKCDGGRVVAAGRRQDGRMQWHCRDCQARFTKGPRPKKVDEAKLDINAAWREKLKANNWCAGTSQETFAPAFGSRGKCPECGEMVELRGFPMDPSEKRTVIKPHSSKRKVTEDVYSDGHGAAANRHVQTIEIPDREYAIERIQTRPTERFAISRIGPDLRPQAPFYVTRDHVRDTWESSMGGETGAELVKRWIDRGEPTRALPEYMAAPETRIGVQAFVPRATAGADQLAPVNEAAWYKRSEFGKRITAIGQMSRALQRHGYARIYGNTIRPGAISNTFDYEHPAGHRARITAQGDAVSWRHGTAGQPYQVGGIDPGRLEQHLEKVHGTSGMERIGDVSGGRVPDDA